MRLNLREIIDVPGGSISFDYEPDISDLEFDSIAGVISPLRAVGTVNNTAGVLQLDANLSAVLVCVCARCLTEFEKSIEFHTDAVIAEEAQDQDNPDIYILDGDYIDVDEIVVTAFVLNMDQRFLCREDCKGLCDKCGKNLNEGPCDCKAEPDPRLAALAQFLEKD